MKTFKIMWINCFQNEGSVRIKAKSSEEAEMKFEKDFGEDYTCIVVIEIP